MAERLGVRGVLDIMAAVAMISVSVFMFLTLRTPASDRAAGKPGREATLPSAPVSVEGLQQTGSMSAPVVLIEYSDFECPYCARFATGTWLQIRRDYVEKGLLRVAFSHFPLDGLHQSARRAAEVSECAAKEGRFWPVHDLFFARQYELQELLREPKLGTELQRLGVEAARLSSCMAGQAAGRVDEMTRAAKALEITGTPTFFVGLAEGAALVRVRNRLDGAVSSTSMATVIDKLVRESASVK